MPAVPGGPGPEDTVRDTVRDAVLLCWPSSPAACSEGAVRGSLWGDVGSVPASHSSCLGTRWGAWWQQRLALVDVVAGGGGGGVGVVTAW